MRPSFYDPAAFAWTSLFAERFDEVAAEIVEQSYAMTPLYPGYGSRMERVRRIATLDGAATKRARWFGRTIMFFTIRNRDVLDAMPVTSALLDRIEGITSAVLVRLDGNTHIPAHRGYTPDVLRCHFGVSVPEPAECVLRVGDERRGWNERDWLIFDDDIEHEVWHRGSQPRTVLLVDVIRPGVAYSPRQVAERFFGGADGTRFDDALEELAPPATWLGWLDHGEFPRA